MNADRHDEVKKIFLEICDLPEAERAAYLERTCGPDAELRREIERLLECDREDDLITSRNVAARYGGGTPALSESVTGTDFIDTAHPPPAAWQRLLNLGSILLIVLVVLGLSVCAWLRSTYKNHLLQVRTDELRTILDTTTRSLRIWIEHHLDETRVWAQTREVIEATRSLSAYSPTRPEDLEQLAHSPLHTALREFLGPACAVEGAYGVEILSKEGFVLDSGTTSLVGTRVKMGWGLQTDWMFRGNPLFFTTIRDFSAFEGHDDSSSTRLVGFLAPITDDSQTVIGGLSRGWSSRPFFGLLAAGRFGRSGETYAFNETGSLISESRFNEELKSLGLISEADGSQSSLAVSLREPGVELQANSQWPTNLAERPFTQPAQLAMARTNPREPVARSGVLSQPYRNYLGRSVIGAWQWIPDYGMPFGVVTEMEVDEALLLLQLLDGSVAVLLGLFLSVTGIGYYSVRKRRLPSLAGLGDAGRYKIIRKIGEGGLGDVYLAEHVLLKLPRAVKLLKREVANADSVKRFEREVQHAGRLTHPNTIQIFDYGLSRDGLFYYVMEYLDGMNLSEVIREAEGPLPVARVVAILRQVCKSLQEAHQLGIVHRDIKPMNIMLCQRGERYDVVKVLDFGLVKQIDTQQTTEVTAPNQVSGTLIYMAPERVRSPQDVDRRTDIYSVGAVGYFLLSGRSPFGKTNDLDILYRVVHELPAPLSGMAQIEVPPGLERLIFSCLAKAKEDRPASAEEMITCLDKIPLPETWDQEHAKAWWEGVGRRS